MIKHDTLDTANKRGTECAAAWGKRPANALFYAQR